MKGKIGIVTLYHRNNNYGGMLQAYALQKVISQNGYIAEQIDYKYQKKKSLGALIRFALRYIFDFIFNYKFLAYKHKVNREIDSFRKKIPHTKKTYKDNRMSELNRLYDGFVCGSDQIWNPIGWTPNLFLDFVSDDKLKVAYAASIAREELNIDEWEYIKKYLHGFDAVSLRENNLLREIKECLYSDVRYMPDPVFLLNDKDIGKFIYNLDFKTKYLFAYFLGANIDYRKSAIEYAHKNKMKVIFLPTVSKKFYKFDFEHSDIHIKSGGVETFITLISNASLVVTDSFHAVACSLILERNFYVLDRFDKNDAISMNSRIDSLLCTFNLSDRHSRELPGSIVGLSEEDVMNIKKTKKELRQEGLCFLDENMKSLLNY